MDYVIFPTKRVRRDVCVLRKPCYTTIEQLLLRENGEETAGIVEKGEEREKSLIYDIVVQAERYGRTGGMSTTRRREHHSVTKTERGSK